jgi:hypothetical protein
VDSIPSALTIFSITYDPEGLLFGRNFDQMFLQLGQIAAKRRGAGEHFQQFANDEMQAY